jgi:hypothetical protein
LETSGEDKSTMLDSLYNYGCILIQIDQKAEALAAFDKAKSISVGNILYEYFFKNVHNCMAIKNLLKQP